MSWICFVCDEIVYDEVWPFGDQVACDKCYFEFIDILEERNKPNYHAYPENSSVSVSLERERVSQQNSDRRLASTEGCEEE